MFFDKSRSIFLRQYFSMGIFNALKMHFRDEYLKADSNLSALMRDR